MSHSAKRGADEAFGQDAASLKSPSPAKKNRRRRSKPEFRDAAAVTPEQPISTSAKSLKKFAKAQRTPEASTVKADPIGAERSSKKASNTRSEPNEWNSESQNDMGKRASDQESASEKKKRQRSKRNHRPNYDERQSQIEAILSRSGELSDSNDVAGTKKRSKKKPDERNAHGKSKEQAHHTPSKQNRHEKSLARSPKALPGWNLSRPTGGAFIDHDPVLTPDHQYLILATKRDIQVYATKTSLLVRTIPVTRAEIVCYTQMTAQEPYLAVGTSDGHLLKYDWTTGKKIWALRFSGSITAVTSTSSTAEGDGFLMVNKNEDGTYHMTSLAIDQNGKQAGRRSLLTQKTMIKPHICFSAELGVAVVCSKDTIMVGRLGEESGDEPASMAWRDIPVIGGKIVCFDAQILPATNQTKKGASEPIVNVAVALRPGEIHVYGEVLRNANKSSSSDLHPRRLHWHRTPPRTVKFSPDSNYLISGGDETVLVIWQFDTNQKQTLPHLTTAILNATIAAQGSAYALRLGDNSVMVLSTSDLQPFANVSNIAVDASSRAPYLPGTATPAVLHPNHPGRLLLAYSLQNQNANLKPSDKPSNMLQTYDLSTQLQLNRQALARNLVSTINIGPTGQPLVEPDVTHLDITYDGKWLVTVDQWSPRPADLDDLYLARGEHASRAQQSECFLRFWSTNNTTSVSGTDLWELNTRIDDAVAVNSFSNKRAILAIAVNPVRPQVAVVDTNRHLKIFSPKARIRSGVPVKNADGQHLFTWTCDHEIPFQEASDSTDPEFAALAFSDDGSVLAASWSTNSHLKARVHFIETKGGAVSASLPDIVSHGRAQLAFYGRYLIGLSEKLCFYDTVSMSQSFALEMDKRFDHSKSRLAVNDRNGVVAIAVSERPVRSGSHLLLFDIRAGYDKPPLFDEVMTTPVLLLLAERDSAGFLVVDGDGRTMKLTPPGFTSNALMVEENLSEKKLVSSSLANAFGGGRKAPHAAEQASSMTQGGSLDDIFKFESSAQAPTAKDLFNRVALVVSGTAA